MPGRKPAPARECGCAFAPCMPLTGSKGWPPTAQIVRRALVAYLVALGAPSAMALSGLPCAVCGATNSRPGSSARRYRG